MFPNDNRFQLANILPPFYVLVMGVIFGGSMIFLTPPFNVPEEDQHFYRSYQCSEGSVYAARNDDSVGGDCRRRWSKSAVATIGVSQKRV